MRISKILLMRAAAIKKVPLVQDDNLLRYSLFTKNFSTKHNETFFIQN